MDATAKAKKDATADKAAKDELNKRTQQQETKLRAETPPAAQPIPVAGAAVPTPATQSVVVATAPPPPPVPPPTQGALPPAAATTSTIVTTGAAASTASRDATQPPTFRAAAETFNERPAGVIYEFASPTPSSDPQGGGGGGGRGGGGAGRGGTATIGLSVAGSRQWRIYASGVVEQSNNGGTSWEKVTLDPQLRVTTGSAPSLNVCWLAGRDGTVLISLNAAYFNKLVFPESVDLTSIRATNAREATVTTADGRSFVTTDGGITWTVR
jgi:hypothetical protein